MAQVSDPAVIERFRWRLHDGWIPTRPLRLDIVTAIDELSAWLVDDHWWRNGSHAGWLSLSADVRQAIRDVSASLAAEAGSVLDDLDSGVAAFATQVRAVRRTPRDRTPYTEKARLDLHRLEQRVRLALATP